MTRRTALAATLALALTAGGVRTTTEYRAAMRSYKAAHPVCEHVQWCGQSNAPAVPHHIQPVWSHPWLACDTNNMIALCDPTNRSAGCHFVCGHRWNWSHCATNVSARECRNRRKE
jgi:hypothetical protein